MDDDTRGFCFNFDGTEPAVLCGDDDNNNKHNNDNNNDGIACATSSSSPSSCASPSVAVSSFAWHTLTPAVVTRWLARYPAPPQSAVTRTTTTRRTSTATRPMQLQLPLRDAAHDAACRTRHNDNDVVVTVHYQSAAELVHLCTPARRDVVPGSYYGSLKVWSCAPQLAHYLVTHADEWRPRLARAAVVAELGCGQGVVGLTAMCLGARRLLFHDYNAEVLECCVQPNVAATWTAAATARAAAAADDDEEVSVQFVHGDWASLCYDQAGSSSSSSSAKDDDDSNTTTATSARCCDVVLGSDVTFDPTACAKLAEVLQRWLCPRHGVALIATKLYYFGTHGGSDVFTREAGQRGLHVAEVARVCDERAMWQVILRVTTSQATTAT